MASDPYLYYTALVLLHGLAVLMLCDLVAARFANDMVGWVVTFTAYVGLLRWSTLGVEGRPSHLMGAAVLLGVMLAILAVDEYMAQRLARERATPSSGSDAS